jgi:DNA-binding MarR family transcriptional regulator
MKREDRLIYLVFVARQKLRNYLTNLMQAEGIRITPSQTGVLFLLKQKDGRTMTELSQLLGADNSSMTGLIDRLEKSGFVRRLASPEDRRALRIHITPDGVEEIVKARAVIRRVNDEIKAGHSEEEIAAFAKILGSFSSKFNRNDSGQHGDCGPRALT